jgi:hypothetical protein
MPVPTGMPGEIFRGGAGVASYLNNETLNSYSRLRFLLAMNAVASQTAQTRSERPLSSPLPRFWL